MPALSRVVVLLAVVGALASVLWRPLILESVPFRLGPLPDAFPANERISTNVQRFFTGQFEAPEHFAFDKAGNIYFSAHDGRIMRTRPDGAGNLTQPELVVYTGEPGMADRGFPCGSEHSENVCGRPLGMAFDPTDDSKLIVADCYLGLFEVDVKAKSKKLLLNKVDDQPLYFTNSVAIGQSGVIYFTDSSSRWRRHSFIYEVMESQPTGRMISFDRRTGVARVLVKNVAFSNGILVDPSAAEAYVLFNELNRARVLRYDLREQSLSGDNAGGSAIDVQHALAGVEDGVTESRAARLTVAVPSLPGVPDNLAWEQQEAGADKHSGVFWIGAGTKRTKPFSLTDALAELPLVRTVLSAVLPKQMFLSMVPRIGLLFRIQLDAEGKHGQVVDTLQDNTGATALLTGAYEHDGFLYIGAISPEVDYLARVPWTSANKTTAAQQ